MVKINVELTLDPEGYRKMLDLPRTSNDKSAKDNRAELIAADVLSALKMIDGEDTYLGATVDGQSIPIEWARFSAGIFSATIAQAAVEQVIKERLN